MINARMPKLTRDRGSVEYPAPVIRGVRFVVDESSKRVAAWITPNGGSFFGRVYESKNSVNRWQCVIRCQGFAAQFGGSSPSDVARIAEEKIVEMMNAFR